MVITFYGLSCFRVQSGETVFVFDPPSKKSKFKSPRFQADAVLISHDHENHNGYDSISGKKEKAPFVIKNPGEYELEGVAIKGIHSFHDPFEGKKRGANTIYLAQIEDMRVCHLGDFGEKELRPETKETIESVDILFVPIGGDSVQGPQQAAKTANQLEPKIVIPMHFDSSKKTAGSAKLKNFIEELGAKKESAQEKLTIKKNNLSQNETVIYPLKPHASN